MTCPRADLSRPGVPIAHPYRIDVPAGSRVTIKTKGEGFQFMGVVIDNPLDTPTADTIVLHKCSGGDYLNPSRPRFKFESKSFLHDMIAELDINGRPEIGKDEEDTRPERMMVTQVVTRFEDVINILNNIEERKIKTVVVSALGENVGRFGDIGWLCLVVNGLLVCIDVLAFRKTEKLWKEFWRMLEKRLLKNLEVTKIFHNARPLTDYLFHKHCITMVSVYDTQLMELYIRSHLNRDRMPKVDKLHVIKEGSPFNWEVYPVSRCYNKFVKDLVLPEELDMLEKHESKVFPVKSNCPYMQRPIPKDTDEEPVYKTAALKVKYLQDVYDVQIKILLSHATLCMREQAKVLIRANSAQAMDRSYIPHNVMEMIMQGSPFLTTNRSEDHIY